jgi:hypothetical protein
MILSRGTLLVSSIGISFFFTTFSVSALEREDLWVCPVVETNLYSLSGPAAFGGGLAVGYGDVGPCGLRLLYAADYNNFATLEIVAFARLFLFESGSGFFIQVEIGPALFFDNGQSVWGQPSIGVMTGWRFPLGKRWFIEPALRIGYPYIAGAGLSAGFRF